MMLSYSMMCTRYALALLLMVVTSFAGAALTANASVRAFHPETRVTYISVTLSNPMSVPIGCRVEFSGYGYRAVQNEASLQVPPIPPGASRTVNVAVPLQNIGSGQVIEDNGNRMALPISAENYGTPNYKGYIHAADPANQLTDPQLDNFTYRLHSDAGSYGYSSSSSGTTRTLSPGDRNIAQAEAETLPENWVCYVPVKSLIIADSAERRLTAPQRDALDTWLAMGGTMMIYGSGEETTTPVTGGGAVIKVKENPVLDSNFTPNTNVQPFILGRDLASSGMPYRETRAGGRNGAFLLATLFLIIVGPVNYFYFARRQQIRMLIITVPVISIAFCSIIAVYFVMTQGFNRKGGSVSITTLDESTNRAVTFARHSLLTGLYPLGGFKFSPQTYFTSETGSDERSGADFDLTRGTVLRGGLFQPGIPFNYSTIMPYTTRERMLFDAEKGEIRNGFELPVKAVAVLDGGQFFRGGGASAGAVTKLTAVDEAEMAGMRGANYQAPQNVENPELLQGLKVAQLVGLLGKDLTVAELDTVTGMARTLAKGVEETSGPLYAALFDGIPPSSDSGVKITEGQNLHVLVGRASANGEATE